MCIRDRPEAELMHGALVELVRSSCRPVEFTWRSHAELMGSPRGAILWNWNEDLQPSSCGANAEPD
eukprot:8496595-Alexandrium_andersonii.AAC.1